MLVRSMRVSRSLAATAWLLTGGCGGNQTPATLTAPAAEPVPTAPASANAVPTASPELLAHPASTPSASSPPPSSAPEAETTSGEGRLSGPQHHAPSMRMDALSVTGGLPVGVVNTVLRKYFGPLRLCYENGLKATPKLEGSVTTTFRIDAKGAVRETLTMDPTLHDKTVAACLVRTFAAVTFPAPEQGDAKVSCSLVFTPGD